LINSNKT